MTSKAAQGPAQEALSPHFPRTTQGLTLTSGAFLSQLGEDAGEGEGGSGESPHPLGIFLREVDTPMCPAQCRAPSPFASSRALALERMHLTYLLSLAGGKGQHIPGLSLSAPEQTEGLRLPLSCAGSW